MINLSDFINKNVIFREKSMFLEDMEDNHDNLLAGIKGKKVLVIGGAGSIGSSYIKAMLPFEPAELIIVDINENALTEITRDINSSGVHTPDAFLTYPMNYGSDVFRKMFVHHGTFDIVANFSAHKHVRSEKDVFSIEAMINNNLFIAEDLLKLLKQYPPEVYFCVSTDKAANPVNIMGASKRLMEDLIFSFSDSFPVKTARFANVAFSNGSLPYGFIERLNKRQPLSAPTDVKRYFVSPEESGQICLMACILGNNREIFFPKLDSRTMMSFDEIAERLLTEMGLSPHYCSSDDEAIEYAKRMKEENREYPVHFSQTDTSGEKQYEEFYEGDEYTDNDRFRALGVIVNQGNFDHIRIKAAIEKLKELFENGSPQKEDVVKVIGDYLPSFHHIEMGRSLDKKM